MFIPQYIKVFKHKFDANLDSALDGLGKYWKVVAMNVHPKDGELIVILEKIPESQPGK